MRSHIPGGMPDDPGFCFQLEVALPKPSGCQKLPSGNTQSIIACGGYCACTVQFCFLSVQRFIYMGLICPEVIHELS